jgi:hypothetical protein
MKPRLLFSSPHTSEDVTAWFRFLDRLRPLSVQRRIFWKQNCIEADRRDADLMLEIGQTHQMRIDIGPERGEFVAWLFPGFWRLPGVRHNGGLW